MRNRAYQALMIALIGIVGLALIHIAMERNVREMLYLLGLFFSTLVTALAAVLLVIWVVSWVVGEKEEDGDVDS